MSNGHKSCLRCSGVCSDEWILSLNLILLVLLLLYAKFCAIHAVTSVRKMHDGTCVRCKAVALFPCFVCLDHLSPFGTPCTKSACHFDGIVLPSLTATLAFALLIWIES